MHYELMHPCDQIAMLMERVYQHGMTTTSGGNLSVIDEKRDIWISPAGVDKGTLTSKDVVRVRVSGEVNGEHRPSSEYPFHKAIYEARPDVGAILHAHPSPLVAFSIARKIPDTRIIPQALQVCKAVGYAPYAVPGSAELGAQIAESFIEGYDSVLLENHGVVCAGRTLLEAYHRFETLDFCARLILKASALGAIRHLSDAQIALFDEARPDLPEFVPAGFTNKEKKLRKFIVELIHRAYGQHIMTATEGVLSARIEDDSFLISPTGMDRRYLDVGDIVHIADGRREAGKFPSRSVRAHQAIYAKHPNIKAIISAQAPNATAFAVTDRNLDTRTIPESYVVLRDIPKVAYGKQFADAAGLAEVIGDTHPVVLLENDCVMAAGDSLLQAFDRLEVAEFTARSLINALPLGPLEPMDDARIMELERAFGLA